MIQVLLPALTNTEVDLSPVVGRGCIHLNSFNTRRRTSMRKWGSLLFKILLFVLPFVAVMPGVSPDKPGQIRRNL
jgi:hypothetical protein